MPRFEYQNNWDPEKGMGWIARKPQRMSIVNLAKRNKAGEKAEDDTLVVQFNPEQFSEELKVAWAQIEPVGLPHRPLQYTGTENVGLSFDLIFDSTLEGQDSEGILKARRFLRALCYPMAGARSVAEGQAPRALFVWPNFLTLTSVVRELSFKYESFDIDGTPVRYTASLKLEQIRDFRTYAEEVMEQD